MAKPIACAGIRRLLSVEGFRLAVDDGAPFLDHSLRGKGLAAAQELAPRETVAELISD